MPLRRVYVGWVERVAIAILGNDVDRFDANGCQLLHLGQRRLLIERSAKVSDPRGIVEVQTERAKRVAIPLRAVRQARG